MKKLLTFAAVGVLAAFAFAQDAAKKAAPAPAPGAAPVAPVIPVTAAVVSAPFVLKDGAISQAAMTEVGQGGKAIFTFTAPRDGNYVISAVANAPDDENNSFFVNIDAAPEDPLTIWDIEHTQGFEERIVGWRGNGDAGAPEFAPKIFKLTAGEHKLNVFGREPAQLKSVSIRPLGQ